MSKPYKLKRPIKDASGENDITEVTLKDESQITAADFYGMQVTPDGVSDLGGSASTIANLLGLTELQVSQMDPKDFIHFHVEVGKLLG